MNSLGLIEVYSFTAALTVADIAAKAADVRIIAFDRNRPLSADVPAPLVMVVKMEGSVAAVRAAVEAGRRYAEAEGKYIVSHIIPRPNEQAEKMAYLMDINKDKFNKTLPKSMLGVNSYEYKNKKSIGIFEISGMVASVVALDAMTKAANVGIIHTEKRLGGRLVSLIISGEVSDVDAALEAAYSSASPVGKVYGTKCIPSPHSEVMKFFDFPKEEPKKTIKNNK